MGVSISRLDLGFFESLPLHTRRCVFWEVDPAVSGHTFESEFDKEAWISGLLLDWGTCGQVAIETSTQSVVGTAFYAPPNRVPRSRSFPTSPVSHDAVLLSSIRTEPGHEEIAGVLLDAVLGDLIRRGVRAVESFGLVRAGDAGFGDISTWTDESIVEVAREILDGPQSDLCTKCMIDAAFLKDSAFDVVSSHPRFPRFRLELDEGLSWKFEVESALEKLVVMAALDLTGAERAAVPVGCSTHRTVTGSHR
ncbi:hypothetical protein QSJ18_07640 [Gordonia sp. ABSL1-1]|uniref:hypothetical protein n=1 Tax=Gordonia sp. ABSL1-1 TaxID=3053923 RepID=UPI002573778C|nr:hypothetical protein [Gordonia sp. ABSL1-1]MDL9936612.1 hypothetical protein [Gordonia sp. ABSL1-1]